MLGITLITPALRSLLPFTLVLLLVGCAPTARLHVTKSLDIKLNKYESVNVTATGSPAEVARAARQFEKVLTQRLEQKKLFKSVGSDGELVIAARVTQMNFGDANPRDFTLRGKASTTIELRITKPDGTLLGHVTVRATARKKSADDQPAQRVLAMAADEVVEYLASRSGAAPAKGKAKSKATPSEEGAGSKGKAAVKVDVTAGDEDDDAADDASDEEPSTKKKSQAKDEDEDEDY